MNGAVSHDGAINAKGKQIANDFEPGTTGASLGFGLAFGVDEVQFGLFHEEPAHNFAMHQRIPLNCKIESFADVEWDGHIPSGLADAQVMNGVGPAPEVDSYRSDLTGIQRILFDG